MTRSCKPSTYVACALKLAKSTPHGVISAQQVAYRAHRKPARLGVHHYDADEALAASGLFVREGFVNGNAFGVMTWRVKPALKAACANGSNNNNHQERHQ